MFAGFKTQITDEVDAVEICKQFGWTYYEYQSTPLWFLDTLRIRNNAEAYFAEKDSKKFKK